MRHGHWNMHGARSTVKQIAQVSGRRPTLERLPVAVGMDAAQTECDGITFSDERHSRSGDRANVAVSAQHQPTSMADRKIKAAEFTS
jgi:hypothetical protein